MVPFAVMRVKSEIMFWKFLLPLLILGSFYTLGKRHARRGLQNNPHPSLTHPPSGLTPKSSSLMQTTATTIVISVITLLAWFIFNYWQESRQVVEIRVIHVQTGKITLYQALKGKIHGRSFLSADGRQITLADVERLEVTKEP